MTDQKIEGLSEQVLSLFDGIDLTEETKSSISVIYEAAVAEGVKTRLEEEKAKLIEQYDQVLEEAKQEIAEEYEAKIDEYITYVAQEWMTENKLAVEQGIRTQIAESLIEDLKGVLAAHDIEIPQEKVDMVAEATKKLEDAEKALNEQVQRNAELVSANQKFQREAIVASIVEGMSEAQVERIKSLSEDIPFADADTFTSKMKVLKEAVGRVKPAAAKQVDNNAVIEEETKVTEVPVIVEEAKVEAEKPRNEFALITSVLSGGK